MGAALFGGGVHLGRVDQGEEKKTESPSSLGLGTIYITPLQGRPDLTTTVWVQSFKHGDGKVLGT